MGAQWKTHTTFVIHPANDSQLTTQIISILMEHKGHIFKFWLQRVQNWRSHLKTSRNPEPGPGAHLDKTLNGHDLDEGVHTQTFSNNIHFRITQKKPPLGKMKWKVERALKAGRTNILQVFQLFLINSNYCRTTGLEHTMEPLAKQYCTSTSSALLQK